MTNLAELFQTQPDAPGLLKGLTVMNGYFGQAPLPEPWYNWNAWADPLATKIVFSAKLPRHRAVPLEVTEQLTVEAARAKELFAAPSRLLQAVLDFGNAWLESSNKLTLHDPLAAVSVFHPDICRFERGTVRVETAEKERMGATYFSTGAAGNVEIARTVDKARFYRLLSAVLA